MALVPSQQLVCPLPREGDGDVLGRQAREGEEAERREVGERLVERPGELGQRDGVAQVGELELVVVGAEAARDQAGVGQLVRVAVLGEADREGLDRLAHVAGHQGDDQARVEPAREHRPQGHVAHQAQAHRLLQLGEQALGVLVLRAARRVGGGQRVVPVALLCHPVGAGQEQLAGAELAHLRERAERAREEAERQVGLERLVVELVREQAACEQALELGGKEEQALDPGEVEGLDPEPVAGENEPTPAPVPEGKAELAAQALREAWPLLLVEVRDDLGVAAGAEAVPACGQLGSQGLVVVELAVLDRPDEAVLACDRLVAAGHIDDREPAHPEGDPGRLVGAAVVGAAVLERVGHPVEHPRGKRQPRLAAELHRSADPAHCGER